jgi:diaminopimelate epimerase
MTEFTKLEAMGNDFLVTMVDDVADAVASPSLARRMCSRNFGAGADGLIVVDCKAKDDTAFSSRIFNADGGEAEVSGNGTRCVAAYLYYSGLWSGPEISIATAAGPKRGVLVRREGPRFDFSFDMGAPELRSDKIPVALDPPLDFVVDQRLDVGTQTVRFTSVSMGNPHCSLFLPDLDDATFFRLGPLIENHPSFPNRTNVEFIRPVSESEIEVRFWERGVGPTLSSGTGSCAAAVAAILNQKTSRRVTVSTAGGSLAVHWRDDGAVLLTASATVVYQAQWLLDL